MHSGSCSCFVGEIDDGFTGNLPNLAESESAKLQNCKWDEGFMSVFIGTPGLIGYSATYLSPCTELPRGRRPNI